MSLYCLIPNLLVCRKKDFFVCCEVDKIKASLFGLLPVNAQICNERFHSHIFSSLSNVCILSDKASWIHKALTKIPFKMENGIECQSITADGKQGSNLTQKAFILTYTKQLKDVLFKFFWISFGQKCVQHWKCFSQNLSSSILFKNVLTYLISFCFTICQDQSHKALWNEFLMWSTEAVKAKEPLLVWIWLML